MTKRIVIKGIKDFDTAHIFECGQCFRWNKTPDSTAYTGVAGGYAAKVGTAGDSLVIEASGGDEVFWRHYFDLETDYSAIKSTISSAEPRITAACDFGSGIRILNQDIFETIISFIISQNNNIPRIKKNIESICRKYGEPLGEYWGEERYAFPSAKRLAAADCGDLAEMKLGYRCEYIIAAAERFLEEGPPADYEAVMRYLGIGPKVANCIMLFGFHKLDSFPIDTWVKTIMNDMYGFEEKDVKGMAQFAREKFGDFAGYAQQYLFYYYREK